MADEPRPWISLAVESRRAAQRCLDAGCYRSSASRSYYAIFAVVTDALLQAGVQPRQDFKTWGHERLPKMAADQLNVRIPRRAERRQLRRLIRIAYLNRILSDYSPRNAVAAAEALESLRASAAVFRILGIR